MSHPMGRVHDEEIDSAIMAVRNPDAPYSPEGLALAAAVEQLRAELAETRAAHAECDEGCPFRAKGGPQ